MSIVRGVKDRRFKFVQILNSMFEDTNLSLKAKGFIGYCLTKTETWEFHVSHLQSVLKEGERAIYSTIDECIEQGYALKFQTRKENGDFGVWETIVSDSKEEIEKIKEELENNPDFQKMFTIRRFADAQTADPQSVPPSNNNNSSNTNNNVVVASTREEIGVKNRNFTKDDLYFQANRMQKDWSSQEIEEAWRIYSGSPEGISSPFDYIEGIIRKKRTLKKSKESKCKTPTNKNYPLPNKESESIKEKNSVEDMREQPLARLIYRNGQWQTSPSS